MRVSARVPIRCTTRASRENYLARRGIDLLRHSLADGLGAFALVPRRAFWLRPMASGSHMLSYPIDTGRRSG